MIVLKVEISRWTDYIIAWLEVFQVFVCFQNSINLKGIYIVNPLPIENAVQITSYTLLQTVNSNWHKKD